MKEETRLGTKIYSDKEYNLEAANLA